MEGKQNIAWLHKIGIIVVLSTNSIRYVALGSQLRSPQCREKAYASGRKEHSETPGGGTTLRSNSRMSSSAMCCLLATI